MKGDTKAFELLCRTWRGDTVINNVIEPIGAKQLKPIEHNNDSELGGGWINSQEDTFRKKS